MRYLYARSLINCETGFVMVKRIIMFEISIILRVILYNSVAVIQTTGATSQINNAKLYVPVFTLSRNDNIKFLEKIEQGFKRTIS